MIFDMTINVSSVIAGCIALGGLAAGWGALRSDLKAQRRDVDDVREQHREKHAETTLKIDKLEHRVRAGEQQTTAVVTKIEGMAEMLREVRDAVLRRAP